MQWFNLFVRTKVYMTTYKYFKIDTNDKVKKSCNIQNMTFSKGLYPQIGW